MMGHTGYTAVWQAKGFYSTPPLEIWPDFQLADPDATSTVTVRDLLSQRGHEAVRYSLIARETRAP